MDIERAPNPDLRAINWADLPGSIQGLVDPGTLPQLSDQCEGMCVTTQGYLAHWQSHDSHATAWDYISTDLSIKNYVKLYTSKHFEMHRDQGEE